MALWDTVEGHGGDELMVELDELGGLFLNDSMILNLPLVYCNAFSMFAHGMLYFMPVTFGDVHKASLVDKSVFLKSLI